MCPTVGMYKSSRAKDSRARGRFPSNGAFLNQQTVFATLPYTEAEARGKEGQKSTWRSSWPAGSSGSFC